jgi:hypothetical protein
MEREQQWYGLVVWIWTGGVDRRTVVDGGMVVWSTRLSTMVLGCDASVEASSEHG